MQLSIRSVVVRFQSTHPRGVRPIDPRKIGAYKVISIHAPARGATDIEVKISEVKNISIHAPARGATVRLRLRASSRAFQSTHPRGVRLDPCTREALDGVFQSTHPRGVRPRRDGAGDAGREISIHAPARGATPATPMFSAPAWISIHAPARGATTWR